MNICELFLFFWTMSIAGWLMEVLVCSIEARKFVNRGFLIGPYCPIYGCGGLILLLLYPFKDSVLLVFVLSIILCSVLEYITSYLMELIFKVRWWDYSNDSFNINGRICLRNALAFGIMGALVVCFVCPSIYELFDKLPFSTVKLTSLIVLIITLADIVLSLKIMQSIRGSIVKMKKEKDITWDATIDIKEYIRDVLLKKSFLYRRIVKVYNNFEYRKDDILDRIKEYRIERKKKDALKLEILVVIGLIGGIICGLFTNMALSIFIGLGVGIIANLLYTKIRGNNDNKR